MTKQKFVETFSSWSQSVAYQPDIDWTTQLSILAQIEELITSDLTLEEITAAIYINVNLLMDAFQFAIGIYDESKGNISYKGMIEDGKRIPDFTIDAFATNRFASWCIRHEMEIFINDMDREYNNYLEQKPVPITGCDPRSAIYVPLRLNHKVVGFITVRTIHENAYRQHQLYILKDTAKALMQISPAGFEVFFREFGRPAETLDLPPIPTVNPRSEMFQKMHDRMIALGNVFMPEM